MFIRLFRKRIPFMQELQRTYRLIRSLSAVCVFPVYSAKKGSSQRSSSDQNRSSNVLPNTLQIFTQRLIVGL